RIGALPPLDGPRPISFTTPSSSRPVTTSETVVRVRPVWRATSARLIGPRSYTVRTTSRSLWTRVCWWVALVGSAMTGPGPPRVAVLDDHFVQSMDKVSPIAHFVKTLDEVARWRARGERCSPIDAGRTRMSPGAGRPGAREGSGCLAADAAVSADEVPGERERQHAERKERERADQGAVRLLAGDAGRLRRGQCRARSGAARCGVRQPGAAGGRSDAARGRSDAAR